MIQQYLMNKGFNEVATQLQKLSSVKVEEPCVTSFRQCVMEGDFQKIP
jgi:hypothetical protein